MGLLSLFPTLIFREKIPGWKKLNTQLLAEIEDIAQLDVAGAAWSEENYPNGFTTYGSANKLHLHSPTFAKLESIIDQRVVKFSKGLDWNLGGANLKMTNCWVNIMGKNSHHSMHLHPLSAISGTFYVQTPKGTSGLKLEDPRLSFFMNTPPKKSGAKKNNANFIELKPSAGELVLFESWMRHEVPMNQSKELRISISFNYGWES